MRQIEVVVKGVVPLLINKFVYENSGSTRRKKEYVPEEEAEKKVYRNSEGELYIPTKSFKAAMIKAGTDFPMKGRKSYKEYIKAGIFFDKNEAILEPNEYVIHEEPVVIQRAMVMSWRPKFESWTTKFIMNVSDEMLGIQQLKEILSAAGKYNGVGSYRPEYGRFEITKFDVIHEDQDVKDIK